MSDQITGVKGIQTYFKPYNLFRCRFWYHSFGFYYYVHQYSPRPHGVQNFAQHGKEEKRMCVSNTSIWKGYTFIRYDGNLVCIIFTSSALFMGTDTLE